MQVFRSQPKPRSLRRAESRLWRQSLHSGVLLAAALGPAARFAFAQAYPPAPPPGPGGPVMAGEYLPAPHAPSQPWSPRSMSAPHSHAAEEKPLPPEIARMPEPEEDLQLVTRRSQLIVTRTPLVKTAIADPTIVDLVQYSPTEFSVIGLALGTTNLLLWFEGNPDPLIYKVTVSEDPDIEEQKRIDYGRLERKLAILFPNSKVYLIPLSGKIVVKGQARDAEEAARILQIIRGEVINQEGYIGGPQPPAPVAGGLAYNDFFASDFALNQFSSLIVNMLEVPGESQVMLRVRIAELSRSQLRQMGIDLNTIFNNGRNFISSTVGGSPSTLTGVFEQGEVSVFLNWLEGNGVAKVLAEPTLTVLSGHAASFLSGAEFAVPTIVGVGGAAGQTTTFRGFGTSIIVTPTVIDRDLIRMRIVPEFSEANQSLSVGGIPGLNSRRVQTTVELREGQTIAIAGLISSQTSTEVTRIPFLGELPCVGHWLFSAKRSSLDETELLVLVTPEIVRPMDADEVPPVPGYEVTPPNRFELYHYNMTAGIPDTRVYQVAPLGSDTNHGIEVPYRLYNPAPAAAIYSPEPTGTYGGFGQTYDTYGPQPQWNGGGYPSGPVQHGPVHGPAEYGPTEYGPPPAPGYSTGQSANIRRVTPAQYTRPTTGQTGQFRLPW
jgi:pilus assembly protein CpaC